LAKPLKIKSGKRDLNCRKAWKYPNEFDGLSAKAARPFKSRSFSCRFVPARTDRFRSGTAHRQHMNFDALSVRNVYVKSADLEAYFPGCTHRAQH
jgi:hypothetical protein